MTQLSNYLSDAEAAAVRLPLEKASFLPPRLYQQPGFYDLEIEHVFMKHWLPVAHVSEFTEPNTYVARDMFNEPILITRNARGEIKAFSNVCRHRTAKIAQGSGQFNDKTGLVHCPYHAWGYSPDGELVSTPQMHRTEGFDKQQYKLPQLRVDIWQGFVFVNFDPDAAALTPQLHTLEKAVAPFRMGEMTCSEFARYPVNWNWKVSLENFTEGYHQASVHTNTIEPYIPSRLQTYDDVDGPYNLFYMPTINQEPLLTLFPAIEGLSVEKMGTMVVVNVFPLFHLLIDPCAVLWLDWEPRGVTDHDLRWRLLVPPSTAQLPDFEARKLGLVSLMKAVWAEDNTSCAGVNAGVRSRHAVTGRPAFMEKSIHQFQNWLLDCFPR